MVFFTCDACGESLKKNQVEKHYNFKCRNCNVLTCVDCQKDFPGDSYKGHTSCITEDEKYGGKNYQPKANALKGLKKQTAWISNLQDLVQAKSNELSGDVKSVVESIMEFENIPRKKAKFMNFAKNALGGGNRASPKTLEKTWELLELALKKPEAKDDTKSESAAVKEEETNKDTKLDQNESAEKEELTGTEDKPSDEEDEVNQGVKKFKGTESVSKEKKKSKKRKAEEDEDKDKGEEPTKKSKVKFDWEKEAVEVLEKKDDMKLKRLKKKLMKRYWDHVGDSVQMTAEEKEKLEDKLMKKLTKSKQLTIDNDVVSLNSAKLVTEQDTTEDKTLKNEVAKVLDDLKNGKHVEGTEDEENKHSFNQWETANLGDDNKNEKFRRLMGLGKKSSGPKSPSGSHQSSVASLSAVKSMFSQQEEQFNRAVSAKRGLGLGFVEEEKKPKNKRTVF